MGKCQHVWRRGTTEQSLPEMISEVCISCRLSKQTKPGLQSATQDPASGVSGGKLDLQRIPGQCNRSILTQHGCERPAILFVDPDLPFHLRLLQTQAFWYQLYFHTREGKLALEQQVAELAEHIWRTGHRPGNLRLKSCKRSCHLLAIPYLRIPVESYYQHRWNVALIRPYIKRNRRASLCAHG